jgi:glycosyltransferase involved in cell wall biosynthesis
LKYAAYAALYPFALWRECSRRRPDVMLVRNAVLAVPTALVAKLRGIPALLSYTDLLSELLAGNEALPRWFIGALRWYETRVPRLFDGVTVISKPLAQTLLDGGVDPQRLTVSLDGADPVYFRPDAVTPAERRRRRAQLKLKAGQKLVLFHGTVEAHHGEALIPRLLQAAAKSQPKLRFLLIVGGPGANALRDAVVGIPNATLLPFQPPEEVGRWAASADLGMVPYPPSAGLDLVFTLKLLEYFSTGLPAVSFGLAAAQAEFGHFKGYRVATDEADFIAALGAMAGTKPDPRLRAKVLKDFSWDAVCQRLDRQLRTLG